MAEKEEEKIHVRIEEIKPVRKHFGDEFKFIRGKGLVKRN